jgi:hypothetical protein
MDELLGEAGAKRWGQVEELLRSGMMRCGGMGADILKPPQNIMFGIFKVFNGV